MTKANSMTQADIENAKTLSMSIKGIALRGIKNNERQDLEDRTSFHVTLDDAVESFEDMKVDDYTISKNVV